MNGVPYSIRERTNTFVKVLRHLGFQSAENEVSRATEKKDALPLVARVDIREGIHAPWFVKGMPKYVALGEGSISNSGSPGDGIRRGPAWAGAMNVVLAGFRRVKLLWHQLDTMATRVRSSSSEAARRVMSSAKLKAGGMEKLRVIFMGSGGSDASKADRRGSRKTL